MFTKDELVAIVALVDFVWKNGGVRSMEHGSIVEGINKKAISCLKALDKKAEEANEAK